MVSLAIAVVCSALISVLMRLGEEKTDSKLGMLTVNYLMCAVLAAVFTGEAGLFPAHPSIGRAAGLGAVNGMLYLAAFLLLQWNVKRNGVVLSSVFMKLGILVPTLLSITVFHETPSAVQVNGFALAVVAIIVMNLEKDAYGMAGHRIGLLALLLVGGMADGMSKVYAQVGDAAVEGQYFLYTFLVALALCIVLMVARHQHIGRKEIAWGLALGVPNYFSARFLLRSLNTVPAVVAYSTFSVGTIVLVALLGILLFFEKLSRRQGVGMAIMMAALVLLNVS